MAISMPAEELEFLNRYKLKVIQYLKKMFWSQKYDKYFGHKKKKNLVVNLTSVDKEDVES